MIQQDMAAKGSWLEECMFEALVRLLEQKPYDKISITEITRKAGVSRMSYYRNYTTKDEIFTKFWDRRFDDSLQELLREEVSIYSFAVDFFKQHRSGNYYWLRFRLAEHLESTIIKVMMEKMNKYLYNIFFRVRFRELSKPLDHYEAAYIAGGLVNLSRYWVQDWFKESPEEMAAAFCRLVIH